MKPRSRRLLRVVVDRQHLTRDRLAGIRSQKYRQRRDIARVDESLQRLEGEMRSLLHLDRAAASFRPAFEDPFDAWALDGAGRDGICTNAEWPQLARQRLRETDQRPFGRRVRAAVR